MKGEPCRAQPKPIPALLQKHAQQAQRATLDKAETAKARKRAHGRCEAITRFERFIGSVVADLRCTGRASETHHLKGGIGRRNRGDSVKAAWKLRVCADCHRLITAHVLVPVNPEADATQIVYRRVG